MTTGAAAIVPRNSRRRSLEEGSAGGGGALFSGIMAVSYEQYAFQRPVDDNWPSAIKWLRGRAGGEILEV